MDVLCSLEADLQDHGINRPLNLGNSVFPEPVMESLTNTFKTDEAKSPSETPSSTPSSLDDTTGKYYEVLNPEGDDIMYISHTDIMRSKCTVQARLLTENDIILWTKPNMQTEGPLSHDQDQIISKW